MLRKRNILLVLIVLASLLAASAIALRPAPAPDRWDQQAQKQTIEAAQPLIEAIKAYTETNSKVPPSLEDLTPNWITEIPTPIVGSRQWSYSLTKRGYDLRVKATKSEPPSLIWMMIFGPTGFDDRSFVYYRTLDRWEIADM